MHKNGLIRKIRLISKFMTSQLEKQTIAIYILPNISRAKGIKIITLGQLIQYNMRNIFLEKSYIKCGGETICRPFFKNSKLSMYLDQESKVSHSFLHCRFSYAKTWELLNLFVRTNIFSSHICCEN